MLFRFDVYPLFSDIFLKMGTTHTRLQVINNTNTDIINISVSSVNGFDWIGDYRPDLTFNGVSIDAKHSEERQLALKRTARYCPFNMTLHFRNGNVDTYRIHQKYAVGCCPGFEHIQKSHNIYYGKVDRRIIIKIENTEQQLQNEEAEKLNKEGIVAMAKKQHETAIKKFEKALKFAHDSFTINSIINNKYEAYTKQRKSLLQKGRQLEADKAQDMSQEAENMCVVTKDMLQQVGILKHTSKEQENLNHASIKVEGNKLFNKAVELETAACEKLKTAEKSNENDDYKAARNIYKEVSNMYKAAKKKFDEGSKIDSEKFGACSQFANDHIEDLMRDLDRIDTIIFTCNMDKATMEEKKKEEMDSQVLINMKLQQQV
jgi:tetratricopeptide (TPR) repeat protein